ncbi:MAG: efflux RND transporter periplasmic adaptor subunit [Candidatus Komeilibacteria bacterium]
MTKRKILISSAIAVVVVGVGVAYFVTRGVKAETRYVTASVTKGTIISTVSGTGQVSASNQIEIKPKVSGDITYVAVTAGQQVATSTVIARLDATDALKAVRDAQTNLETARLSLEKLQQPVDELTLTQAENSLAKAKESKQTAEDNLAKSYDDGFNTVANAFLDLPGIVTGLNTLLFSVDQSISSTGQWNIDYYTQTSALYDTVKANQYRDDAQAKYETARTDYDQNFQDYKAASRYSSTATIESLISQTYETTKNLAEAIKSANNLIQFYKDQNSLHGKTSLPLADTHLTILSGYTSKTNTLLTNTLNAKNNIENYHTAITSAERTINESEQSLTKTQAGTDALDLRSAQLTINQRQDALSDARQALADYTITAPFGGIIAAVEAKKGDSASSGTTIATLITQQKIAEISLTEVDAVKVKVGQKATLTFDAIDGLSITGEVVEVDSLGTVSQGVVSYTVKIAFDTQDDRVKSGMSSSAAIVNAMSQDVLTVPNGAIKTSGSTSYVEMFDSPLADSTGSQGALSATAPKQVTVEIGLADDTNTEITSGLNEGDQVVSRTISSTSSSKTTTKSTTPSLFGGGGGAPMR